MTDEKLDAPTMATYDNQGMNWSCETYRLDEIVNKFPLPCVISVNEGYYSETDAEGFSSGDILSIDKKVVLHKVAANFAYESRQPRKKDKDYVDLVEREILVPLNYRGKLKVLKHEKNYDSVSELARDFPRYAKLRENWKVRTEDNVVIEVTAGTVIELDRVIPGSTYGPNIEPDKLVVMFKHRNHDVMVAMPYTDKAKFITEQDSNKYTIQEAIDRYSLPQYVKFVDDEIRRVYTQDLMEGLANMKTITETLRLNRLLTQTVLVGHYKPVEEPSPDEPTDVRKRTLIVIPLDNKEIREIDVNVLLNATEDDYETILGVRNVSNTDELVDGSLYVDFAVSMPGIKRIEHKPFVNRDTDNIPPPVPPKPPSVARQGPPTDTEVDDDYIIPSPPQRTPPVSPCSQAGFSLADLNFDQSKPIDIPKRVPEKKKKNFFRGKKSSKHKEHSKPVPDKTPKRVQMQLPQQPAPEEGLVEDPYETVDPDYLPPRPDFKALGYHTPPPPRPVVPCLPEVTPPIPTSPRPAKVMIVHPSAREQYKERKLFKDLNCEELVERLKFCGLVDFAKFCETQVLNGAFFENMTTDLMKETMDLRGIQLAKFIQMRDENWIPS